MQATYFGTGRSVASFYGEASGGALKVSGDVLGPYSISADGSACTLAEWRTQADAAARDAGVDLSGYTHFAYLFPRV